MKKVLILGLLIFSNTSIIFANQSSIDLNQTVLDLTGKEITLESLLGKHKALILDFWASRCGPCMRLMPELIERAHKLEPMDVNVVGVNIEEISIAKEIKIKKNIDFTLVVEKSNHPLSNLLKISSIPRMVVIVKTEKKDSGKILFNGHPTENQKINDALKAAGVNFSAEKESNLKEKK